MFKKDISPGSRTKVKSSAQRSIRQQVLETYPKLEPYIEEIIPKKEQLDMIKLPDRVTLYALHSTPLFFQQVAPPFLPHLTLIHKYPECFNLLRCDRGAIRFVLSGASLMIPGLTSPGGRLPDPSKSSSDEEYRWGNQELNKGDVVVVEAEGKDTACFVGVLKVGTEEFKKSGKGQGFEAGHYLGDGLWKLQLD